MQLLHSLKGRTVKRWHTKAQTMRNFCIYFRESFTFLPVCFWWDGSSQDTPMHCRGDTLRSLLNGPTWKAENSPAASENNSQEVTVGFSLCVAELHRYLEETLKHITHIYYFTMSSPSHLVCLIVPPPTLGTTATPPNSFATRSCMTHLKASFTWMRSSLSTAMLFSLGEDQLVVRLNISDQDQDLTVNWATASSYLSSFFTWSQQECCKRRRKRHYKPKRPINSLNLHWWTCLALTASC